MVQLSVVVMRWAPQKHPQTPEVAAVYLLVTHSWTLDFRCVTQ